MHRQPENIWRFDCQLGDDDDSELELREGRVRARIDAHLALIGGPPAYRLLWSSIYKAHCLTLPAYRQGRVLFAGDAAHLVPIFGVRGMNSGIDDAANLAWKLAAVLARRAGAAMLDSYSEERVFGAQENIRQARKSTLFMTPPSRGYALMREAALSLSVSHPFARDLVKPRQTTATTFATSPLQTGDRDGGWCASTGPGATLPNGPLSLPQADGTQAAAHLLDLVGLEPTVLLHAGDAAAEAHLCEKAAAAGIAVVILGTEARPVPPPARFALDSQGRIAAVLGWDRPGAGYLVRPDGHIAARWRQFDAAAIDLAIERLWGRSPT
jgi:3-(3-hydroxy-phenyl)propionate hydroxylase